MSLDGGGHLTHGAKPNLSGKWFNAIQYGVDVNTLEIDYEEVEFLAKKNLPKLIIAGGSAVPRQIDFKKNA
jgi:glycine hydroxymethyltransferase